MVRLHPVKRDADARTRELLDGVEKKMGKVPNVVATMANSPVVAEAYLGVSETLSHGRLPATLREQIALTVSEANQCQYCLSAHSFLGSKAGLGESDILDARHGTASDEKTGAALAFARKIVEDRGHVNDEDVEELRRVGFSDGEITEIIANVILTMFTNYFNHVAGTEVDFPAARVLVGV